MLFLKIVIVDDDNLVASSLKTIIEASDGIKVLAVGFSGEEAIELYKKYIPDVLLMDIRMTGITGLESAEKIFLEFPHAKILFLTTFADDEYIIKALKIGAKGYILKQHYDSIIPALNAVLLGQSVFGEEIVQKLPLILSSSVEKKSYLSFGLIDKEFEIITLISQGLSNKEISNKLFLSEGTVRNYISVIFEKLNLRDRTQLAIFYFNNLG